MGFTKEMSMKEMSFVDFEVPWSNVNGQAGHRNVLTVPYLENPLSDRHQICITGSLVHIKELYDPLMFLRSKFKAHSGHRKTLSVYICEPHC